MTNPLCPCCMRPLEDGQTVDLKDLSEVRMSKQHKVILAALIRAYPRSVTLGHLVDQLYSSDPNGGPVSAEMVLRVRLTELRKRLPEHGWAIPSNTSGKGNRGTYRLKPVRVTP